MDVLLLKKSGSSTNRGFRSMENQVLIYFQERSGFSYFYPKRSLGRWGLYNTIRDLR
jgi:hypothetical protein